MSLSQAPRLRLISPPGSSALAIIEVRGPDAGDFLRDLGLLRPSQARARMGNMRLVSLDLGEGLREQALVVATARGFEIQIHGNPLLVDAVLARGGRSQAELSDRPARVTWEEIVLHHAREAPGRRGLRLALFQLGESGLCGLLRRIARGHAVEEGLRSCEQALTLASSAAASLRSHRIVLMGRVNAGKSTLFNLLIGRERVRTGPRPALTRDPVEEDILYRDWALTIVDTAGHSERLPDLDQRAGHLALREGSRADLVLWLHSDTCDEAPPELEEGHMVLQTHHEDPKLDELRLDLLRMAPALLRSHLLDLVLTRLGLDEQHPMASAPLDESMAQDLRWLLDHSDPGAAARILLGPQGAGLAESLKPCDRVVDRGEVSESTPVDEPGEA